LPKNMINTTSSTSFSTTSCSSPCTHSLLQLTASRQRRKHRDVISRPIRLRRPHW
jgi:hypothetical protein